MKKTLLTLILLSFNFNAHAGLFGGGGGGGSCDQCVVSAVDRATNTLVASLEKSTLLLYKTLQNGFSGVVTASNVNNDKTNEFIKNGASAQIDTIRNTSTASAVYQAEAAHDLGNLPNPCLTGGAAESARMAKGSAENLAISASATMLNSQGLYNDNQIQTNYQKYLSKYAQGKPLQDIDINAASLLVKGTYSNQASIEAAKDYSLNLNAVSLPPPIASNAIKSSVSKSYLLMQRSLQSQVALSQFVSAGIYAENTPVPGLAKSVGNMYLAMKNAIYPGKSPTSEISYNEFRSTEVSRRYENPNWYVQIAGASSVNVIKEQAFMQALALSQNQEIIEQNRKQLLLLSSINNSLVAQRAASLEKDRSSALK